LKQQAGFTILFTERKINQLSSQITTTTTTTENSQTSAAHIQQPKLSYGSSKLGKEEADSKSLLL
jgi:hypothetical protein